MKKRIRYLLISAKEMWIFETLIILGLVTAFLLFTYFLINF